MNGANGMACGLRVSANKPPAIQAIEMLFSISDKEPRGVAQKNDNLTSPAPIFPFASEFNSK